MTFIQKYLKYYTLTQLCTALKFPRSTYYKDLICVPSDRQKEYKTFSQEVKRVQRHMKAQGLHSVVVKKYNHHAKKGAVPDDKENILKRNFETDSINQKWCTDITYIHV